MTGGSISGKCVVFIQNPSNGSNLGSFSMSGGTMTATNDCFFVSSDSQDWNSGFNFSITDGTFEADRRIFTLDDNQQLSGFSVTGGTFTASEVAFASNPINELKMISGGTFSTPVPENYCAEGYEAYNNGNGTWTVKPAAVATVNGARYATLAEAIAAANASNVPVTINLLKDCDTGDATISAPLALTNAGATLDLNEKTITVNNNFSFVMAADNITVKNGNIYSAANSEKKTGYNSYILVIGGAGTNDAVTGVKLTDVTMRGGVSVGGSSDAAYKGTAKNTVIENCNITSGDYYAVCSQNKSDVTIKSGTYTSNQTAVNNGVGNLSPRVLYGSFVGEDGPEGSIIVEGGTFIGKVDKNYDATNGRYITLKGGVYSVEPSDKLVAEGYEAVAIDGGKYQVGEIQASAIAPAATTTEGYNATYTATKQVISTDGENNVLSTDDAIIVNVKTANTDVANTSIKQVALDKVVSEAIETANTTENTINVDIKVVRDNKGSVVTVGDKKSITYEVHPVATITANGEQLGTFVVSNDQIASGASFTIKLPVPNDLVTESGYVKVTHKSADYEDELRAQKTATMSPLKSPTSASLSWHNIAFPQPPPQIIGFRFHFMTVLMSTSTSIM